MTKCLSYFGYFFLFTIYIYSLVFVALPVNAKLILEGIGLVISIPFLWSRNYKINRAYQWIFKYIFIIVIWDVTVSLINGTSTYFLINAMVTPLGGIFGAHLLYSLTKKNFKGTDDFLRIVVITVFVESLITVSAKVIPEMSVAIRALLVPSDSLRIDNIEDHYRLVGIGNAVAFGVLSSFSIGVISCVYLLSKAKGIIYNTCFYVIYFLICFISFLVARTALLIIGISVVLLLCYFRKVKLKKIIGLVIVLICFVYVTLAFLSFYIDETMMEWAFGFILDKELDSGSSGMVIDWWENIDFDLKTLLVGDGLYTYADGTYYMHTDVGYFRQIYYGGVVGLFLMLYFHFRILLFAYKANPNINQFLFLAALMCCYLAILIKGDANMLSYFILILVYYTNGIFIKKRPMGDTTRCLKNTNVG